MLPDSSRYIYFSDSKVYMGDIVTKQLREIFSVREGAIRSIGISQDRQLIYFAAGSTESNIWLLDLQ